MPQVPRWLLGSALALVVAGPSTAHVPAGETIVSALAGPPKASFLARIRAGEMGGVILVGSWKPAEFAAVTRTLHATSCEIGRPLLILVDQEGGFARRLTWAAPRHSAGELGQLGVAETQREAAAAATALRNAGVDVDLAPVTDTRGRGGFLRGRSFGSDPSVVARLATTFIRTLQAGGVAATAKHFPGLGAARQNTDDRVVSVRTTQLGPFRSAINAGAKLVMVSSAAYPKLDRSGTPAVFSHPIVSGLLRRSLGFRGVVVTDALDAPAAARTPNAPVRALAAGVDLLLYTSGSTAHRGYEELVAASQRSAATRAQLARAVAHIRVLKSWLGRTC
ncbi:MAG: beta-N-acetylhexosaminidase [Actinomycetota bacterium]|nr:beta-N-acetylhexosaminidase [Actinomycetota bacterium]